MKMPPQPTVSRCNGVDFARGADLVGIMTDFSSATIRQQIQ